MRIRAEGAGWVRGVLEPSDPIVLVEPDGTAICGPVFWDGDVSRPEVVFTYDGPTRYEFCVAVVRADGVLAWQGGVQRTPLYRGGIVKADLGDMMEPECPLLPEDHEWLREHRGEPVRDEELAAAAFIGRYYSPELSRDG